MKLITTHAVIAAVLVALALPQLTQAAVEPGVEYPAGTRIDTPGTGVEFVIPQGWNGILPKGGTFFVLGSPEQQAYIFIMVDKKTVKQAKETMEGPLPLGNGLTLQPNGGVRREGTVLSGNYSVAGGKNPMTGYILTRVARGVLGITYVAISAPDKAMGVQDVVHRLSEETVLEQP